MIHVASFERSSRDEVAYIKYACVMYACVVEVSNEIVRSDGSRPKKLMAIEYFFFELINIFLNIHSYRSAFFIESVMSLILEILLKLAYYACNYYENAS